MTSRSINGISNGRFQTDQTLVPLRIVADHHTCNVLIILPCPPRHRHGSSGEARSLHRHLLHQPHERRRVLDDDSAKTMARPNSGRTRRSARGRRSSTSRWSILRTRFALQALADGARIRSQTWHLVGATVCVADRQNRCARQRPAPCRHQWRVRLFRRMIHEMKMDYFWVVLTMIWSCSFYFYLFFH